MLAVLAAGLWSASALAGTAQAASPTNDPLAAVDQLVTRMEAAGASQTAIDTVFARNGLVRVDAGLGSEITPFASTSNDITLGQPTVYYDDKKDAYVARATFSWKHNCNSQYYRSACEQKDCPLALFSNQPCGGPDGFGVRWNHSVNEYLTHYYTYDVDGYQWTWSYPETMDAYGASWVEPDTTTVSHAYNWDQGTLYFWFYLNGCTKGTPFKLYSQIDHTWQTTAVTGFGVHIDGFDVSLNNTDYYWKATNSGPTYWYPCG